MMQIENRTKDRAIVMMIIWIIIIIIIIITVGVVIIKTWAYITISWEKCYSNGNSKISKNMENPRSRNLPMLQWGKQ